MAPPVFLDTLLKERSAALLQSATDYRRYSRHLSSRLHSLRRVLKVRRRIPAKTGKAVASGAVGEAGKYKTHVPTAGELSADKRFAGILLLAAERAWAQAMETKASLENNIDGASGKRRHVASRLERARKYATALVSIVENETDKVISFSDYERLQILTYASLLSAAGYLEARNYASAATQYAIAYTGLSGLILSLVSPESTDDENDMADLYRDLLSSSVEPVLKFSATQLDASARSSTVFVIAHHYLPESSPVIALVRSISKNDVKTKELLTGTSEAADALTHLPAIKWRSHTAQLRDATIAATIVTAKDADDALFSSDAKAGYSATDFDPVLLAWQDVVDAVHESIAEVSSSSTDGAQSRTQELYIVSTYANYNLISRRIARDNILVSQLRTSLAKKQKKLANPESATVNKMVVGKVRAIAGMYDALLQSISQIVELPGVAADEGLTNALLSLQNFYQSLRIGTSAVATSPSSREAVDLWTQASDKISEVDEMALNLDDIGSDYTAKILFAFDVPAGRKFIATGLKQSQTLAEEARIKTEERAEAEQNKGSQPFVIDELTSKATWVSDKTGKAKYVDLTRLVDLDKIVSMSPVPAKPVFFDIAFNFIGYEDGIEKAAAAASTVSDDVSPLASGTVQQEKKKTWFWGR